MLREIAVFGRDFVEDVLAVIHQVHLVDRDHDVRNAQQRGDEAVPLGLRQHAFARVDQHDGELGGRCAGHHVARVLNVAGRVGDDELAPRRREVAIGHVDGDVLLALGAQTIGQQRQVDIVFAAALARALDRLELVFEDRLGVIEQAANQRALAVVHAARGREAQQLHLAVRIRVVSSYQPSWTRPAAEPGNR